MQRRWSWFALRAYRGEVHLAAKSVSRLAIETYVPLVKSESGKRIVPMFEEYFFARWCEGWAAARYARGVASVVYGAGGSLGYVANVFVRTLQSYENKRGIIEFETPIPPVVFVDGDTVVPLSGTFQGKTGAVSGSQSGHYVQVLFSLIGREVSVEYDVRDLELATASS